MPDIPATPAPAPIAAPDALQQYRIEQLEKALEKLEGKQQTFEGQATTNLNATIAQQTALYGNHLDTLSHWGLIITIALTVLGYLGTKWFIKTLVTEKVDGAVKDKLADVDRRLNEQLAKQIEQGKEIEALKAFEEGNRAYDKGEFENAIAHFTRSLEILATHEAYNNRGAANYALGQHQAAIADYNEALRLQPDDADAYSNRGNAKTALGQHEAAIADYAEALRLQPDHVKAHYNIACVQALQGKAEEALAALEVAIAGDAKNRELAKNEVDFASLRDNPRFKQLVGLE